ncbi:hypothetical protein [Halobacillus kuroshimensis]|nr:hypothetical protein [Halobacillus kuroshimensis]
MTHTVDVTGVEDCGNAPKKLWLKAFNEAFKQEMPLIFWIR